jgi:hypothetical protein
LLRITESFPITHVGLVPRDADAIQGYADAETLDGTVA